MTTRELFQKKLSKIFVLGLLFSLAILAVWGIQQLKQQSFSQTTDLINNREIALATEPILPIPINLELDEAKVQLGNQLFHDPKLSSNDTISCATCHLLDKGGTDRIPTSVGMLGSNTGVNSPTVYNSGFLFRYFWDGRAKSLEEQIEGPISAAKEMGGLGWSEIIEKLNDSPEYVKAFKKLYNQEINQDNIKDAIATFERSLYTPNAQFDYYLKGNKNAISQQAKEGYSLFKSYGCITCHQGMLVGGNMFQSLGLFGDYFADRGNVIKSDYGRYNITGKEEDRYVFKVPSLRNIELTAPYFHDGNPQTLDEAIKLMGKYQLGVDIPQQDVDLIISFLRSLTGEYQGEPLS
ncbi:MAG: cytochrome-c peroxidase [Xenococcus sp. MO_188.B8]|nr:cytochrome-c peroxidase [Xenococcus sp. MO_188.B8]